MRSVAKTITAHHTGNLNLDKRSLIPHLRREAKLVKLADKICNLRDILASPPAAWSPERKQGYFDWAAQVVAGVRGVHPELETVFDGLLARHAELH